MAVDTELDALMRLLTDDNPRVAEGVRARLLERIDDAEVALVSAVRGPDTTLRSKAQELLDDLRLERCIPQVLACAAGGDDAPPLEVGALALARMEYPGLDTHYYLDLLDGMAAAITGLMGQATSWRTRLALMRDHLFGREGFSGNVDDYYDPENSYLNRVLERRLGIPISLALVYLAVARRLGLPVHPVGMPGHFILRYGGARSRTFIDPFGGGRLLSRDDCVRFLRGSGLGYREEYLQTTSQREVLSRILRNLEAIYKERRDAPRLARVRRLSARLTAG